MLQADQIEERINWLTKLIRNTQKGMETATAIYTAQIAAEKQKLDEYAVTQQAAKADYDKCMKALKQKAKYGGD